MNKFKAIIISVVFCLIIGGLTVAHAVLPDEEISLSERRKKQQFPEISVSSLMDGKFMRDFEAYLCDQFPLRESFRKLKSEIHFNVFAQSDKDSVYVVDSNISELDSRISYSSVEKFCNKLNSVYEKYLEKTNCRVYYSIIPDKNRFIAKENGYPSYDYGEIYEAVDKELSHMTKIEIDSLLSDECYYRTDSHWRQEKILPVAKKINEAMGMRFNKADEKVLAGKLYGVYYPRAAMDIEPDDLFYLTNETIEGCTVINRETDKKGGIYNMDKLSGGDAYDVFLSGATPLIEITNPKGDKEKELVIVRDSFASSLTPLLISDYSKVTLIDIRYMSPDLIRNYVSFNKQDVLFIYSTMLVNNSASLR